MGGGGGSFPSDFDPKQVEKELSSSLDETKKAEFESKVASVLNDLLIQYNERDTNKIKERLEEIKKNIESDIDEGSLYLNFGGSIKKHTYVDGLSDIDSLVILNDTELADKSPNQVQDFFLKKLSEKLKDVKSIDKGNLAVTVEFKDGMTIQLLPAIKTKTGIKIPASSGTEWSNIINPRKFADKLTQINSALNGKAIPAVKVIKSINSQLPEKMQMTGYHVESLAIEAFKSFDGEPTTKNLIMHYFERAKDIVRSPIKDKTGQSIHMDDYLGAKNSDARKGISYQLEFISRKIKEANRTASVDQWNDILGEL